MRERANDFCEPVGLMANEQDKRTLIVGGIALMALGAFLILKGIMTTPGAMAIVVPKYQDWTRTEAVVIGIGFICLGIYAAVFLRKRP